MFEDVNEYQYQLPAGVTPLSGLTLEPGFTNVYVGSNTASINLASPTDSYTIQIRPKGNCFNANPGDWSDLRLQRTLPTLSGPSTMRCGETDVKTFTLQNLTNTSCITSYTWLIANKGWKYNGTVPTTDITTTSPSIQLVSNDNNAAPPQSVSVIINTTTGSTTVTRNITYLAPTVTLQLDATNTNFDCNSLNFIANTNTTNQPLTPFTYLWNSGINTLINGNLPPYNSTINKASLYRDPNFTDPVGITVSLNASCGVITSSGNSYGGFSGCVPWPNYQVYGFADPLNGGGNIVANIEGLAEAGQYEWYISYFGQTYLLAITGSPYLQTSYSAPSADDIGISVRAQTSSGYTSLMPVGSYSTSGGGYYRMAATTSPIKVSPNPIKDIVQVEFDNKEKPYTIELYTWKGIKTKEVKANNKRTTVNVANLPKGKYVVVIHQGKKMYSTQIEK